MNHRQEMKERLRTGQVLIDCHTHVGMDFGAYLQYAYPYALSLEDLIIRMDRNGIDYSVAFPFGYTAYFEAEAEPAAELRTTDRSCRHPYQVENRNLMREVFEIFPEFSDRILPFAMFDPGREVPAQIELLSELNSEYGIFGLKCATTYTKSFIRDLLGPGRPLLDLAVQHDIPILMHASYDKRDPWASVDDLVSIADSTPEVRFTIAHSARFHIPTLEKAASLPNCYVDLSAFDIHCTLAVENNPAVPPEGVERFDAPYDTPETVMRLLCERYPDTIIWGSDVPFNYFVQKYRYASGEMIDLSLRSRHDRERELLGTLPEKLIEAVSWKNTLRFLFGNP